ncbi:hypothetical protein O181_024155 [Austropuccinia psidii MF-1]|uniref:Uncharacterized protein n=1 Tax=Austropuccinia psidii MF-1 TaxID=1389203 RepID=A0A9Q3CKG2_9BASI|nr:hypothetical protein [Austropuccinia psidii MF-1]
MSSIRDSGSPFQSLGGPSSMALNFSLQVQAMWDNLAHCFLLCPWKSLQIWTQRGQNGPGGPQLLPWTTDFGLQNTGHGLSKTKEAQNGHKASKGKIFLRMAGTKMDHIETTFPQKAICAHSSGTKMDHIETTFAQKAICAHSLKNLGTGHLLRICKSVNLVQEDVSRQYGQFLWGLYIYTASFHNFSS